LIHLACPVVARWRAAVQDLTWHSGMAASGCSVVVCLVSPGDRWREVDRWDQAAAVESKRHVDDNMLPNAGWVRPVIMIGASGHPKNCPVNG
jgi:hypothetical protein